MKVFQVLLLSATLSFAGDWPQFRGPNANGVSEETNLPTEFGPNKNVVWKTPLPPGHSSPSLAGKKIFLTAFEGEKLFTYALDRATGKILNPFGHGASPILYGGTLLMNCDQDSGAFLLAVDKKTGRVRWRTERPHAQRGYGTPVLYKNQALVVGSYRLSGYDLATGKELWWVGGLPWQVKPTPIVVGDIVYFVAFSGESDPGQQEIIPAFTDALSHWDKDKDGRLSPDEVTPQLKKRWESLDLDHSGYVEERDWQQYRYRRLGENALRAYRIGGQGDLTERNFLWKNARSLPNVPSPLYYRGVLYTVKEGGILTSYDVKTGEIIKQARLSGAPGPYYSSPVAADGKLYMISEEGKAAVVEAGAQWEILAVNDMGDGCHGTPAVADGRLYIRTHGALYCFAK